MLVQWIQAPHFIIALLTPLLMSLGLVLVCLNFKDRPSFSVLHVLVLLGICSFLSSLCSWWTTSDSQFSGLQVFPWAVALYPLACIRYKLPPALGYPVCFVSILVADVYGSFGHPDFPYGLGGAGFLDSLFITPLLCLGLSLMVTYWAHTGYLEVPNGFIKG